jgi:hypothetical protein
MPLDPGQLVDFVSTALFASVGIWAAVVRRHWFLRFASVGVVVGLALLIPAYEVVIEFAVQMAVIALGVALYSGQLSWRPRMSLETALLAMVVAAVAAAVVGAAPSFALRKWVELIFVGVFLGAMSLLCLWVACGEARVAWRIAGGAAGIVACMVLFHSGNVVSGIATAIGSGSDWRAWAAACYRLDYLTEWAKWFAPTVALGVATLVTILAFGQRSGWFGPALADGDEREHIPNGRSRTVARLALVSLFAAIATPNFYLLYRLGTPPARLPEPIPADNGYDDLVAAGQLPGVDYTAVWQDPANWSDAQLVKLCGALRPVLDRAKIGLGKPCWSPHAYSDEKDLIADKRAVRAVELALRSLAELAKREDRWDDFADLMLLTLEVREKADRGQRGDGAFTDKEMRQISTVMGGLSASACRRLAARVLALDRDGETAAIKIERQQIYRRRSSWMLHLQELMDEWTARRQEDAISVIAYDRGKAAILRVLAVEMALQAYWVEHRQIPEQLDVLIADYLPGIPADPFGNGTLRFTRYCSGYGVYSVWVDGQDNKSC